MIGCGWKWGDELSSGLVVGETVGLEEGSLGGGDVVPLEKADICEKRYVFNRDGFQHRADSNSTFIFPNNRISS